MFCAAAEEAAAEAADAALAAPIWAVEAEAALIWAAFAVAVTKTVCSAEGGGSV